MSVKVKMRHAVSSAPEAMGQPASAHRPPSFFRSTTKRVHEGAGQAVAGENQEMGISA
jgi:hypothetical protein